MKRLLLISGAGLLAAAASPVLATDGTITFNGLVTDQTCEIATPEGRDFTVTLPTVSAATLNGEGQTAGRTPFSINLQDCSEGQVATYFEPGPTVDFESGRLINQAADGAQNVQIQLLGDNNLAIPVRAAGAGGAQENSQWVAVEEGGAADLNYYAEYFATGAASAGEVNSSVQYTIIYQ